MRSSWMVMCSGELHAPRYVRRQRLAGIHLLDNGGARFVSPTLFSVAVRPGVGGGKRQVKIESPMSLFVSGPALSSFMASRVCNTD